MMARAFLQCARGIWKKLEISNLVKMLFYQWRLFIVNLLRLRNNSHLDLDPFLALDDQLLGYSSIIEGTTVS